MSVIDAQIVRHQEGSGECLVSSGFPLPKGLVTEQMIKDGLIRILINEEEIAANVSALRGRHHDGTLRSILIQFAYDMKQEESIPAQVVINDGTREFEDPKYQKPTLEIIENNNVIFPVGADYLTSTNITLRNLLPFGEATKEEENFYTNLAEDRFDHLFPDGTNESRYEPVSGVLSLWARSGGDIKFWNGALAKGLEYLKYHTPSPSTPDDYCKRGTIANPDGREPAYDKCSISLKETMFAMGMSYAQLYLLTGYRDFWGTVSVMLDSQQQYTNSQKDAYDRVPTKSRYDHPRFSYASRFGALIPALMVDAASDPEIQTSYTKYHKDDWAQQVEWVINALTENKQNVYWIPFENGSGTEPSRGTTISQGDVTAKYLMMNTHKWKRKKAGMLEKGYIQVSDISGGSFTAGHLSGIDAEATGSEEEDYRNGLVGTRSWTRSGLNPIFQFSAFTMNFLIDYYLYIKADSRIPSIVKTWCDIMLKNKVRVEEGDGGYKEGIEKWGEPYMLRDPIEHSGVSPWTLPIHSRVIAFTLKTHGVDETVNDKTYSEWYNICIDPKNLNGLIWQWRHFGQFYGWNQDAPWMMAQESLIKYGPDNMRKPKQYNKIPGNQPDIEKIINNGEIDMSYIITSESNEDAIKWRITLNDSTHEGDVVDGKVEWSIPEDLPTGEHRGEAQYGYPEYTVTTEEEKVLAGTVWSDPVEFTLKRRGNSEKPPILKIIEVSD